MPADASGDAVRFAGFESFGAPAMRGSDLEVVECGAQKAYLWIEEVASFCGLDKWTACRVLRAVLLSVRDHLGVRKAVLFGEHLPVFIRGIYYDGWKPWQRETDRSLANIHALLRRRIGAPAPHDASLLIRFTLTAIGIYLEPDAMFLLRTSLPAEIRPLERTPLHVTNSTVTWAPA
jgi:uncharacterized protein (DUF2267 family)